MTISFVDWVMVVERVRGGGGGGGGPPEPLGGGGGGAGALAGPSTGVHVPEKSGWLCATANGGAKIASNRQARLNMLVPSVD
jgi:hypothetical protein